MPLRYDAGAVINELERLKLFAIEHSHDFETRRRGPAPMRRRSSLNS
jgi:hypothetical protein